MIISKFGEDRGDAHMLTDMVRIDSRQLRAVAGDSPGAGTVKVVARTRKTLIWERTRQAPAAAPPAAGVLPRRAGRLR
jgi:Transposase